MKKFVLITFLFLYNSIYAQDFIRAGASINFSNNNKDLLQSMTFDLNRTKANSEKDQDIYFLYSQTHYYILPVIDINLGEKNKISENNIKSAFRFGKNYFFDGLTNTYFFTNLELTYNSDKDFSEKLYYFNINGGFQYHKDNEYRKNIDFDSAKVSFIIRESEMKFSFGSLNRIGKRMSKTFDKNNNYILFGCFVDFKFTINTNNLNDLTKKYNDSKNVPKRNDLEQSANWSFSFKSRLLSILDELNDFTNENVVGFLEASIEKSINKNISFSVNYKYGNDQPKYEEINGLEFGFKYKFSDFK